MIVKFPESADVDMEMFGKRKKEELATIQKAWRKLTSEFKVQPPLEIIRDIANSFVLKIMNEVGEDTEGRGLDDSLYKGKLYKKHTQVCDQVFSDVIARYKKKQSIIRGKIGEMENTLGDFLSIVHIDNKKVKKYMERKYADSEMSLTDLIRERFIPIMEMWKKVERMRPEDVTDAILAIDFLKTGRQSSLGQKFVIMDYDEVQKQAPWPLCLVTEQQLWDIWFES